ncbi:hypothetical protein A2U01_0098603, partial [Trifolium medium]|nr:hypothetical protein [Trifolium medium]
CFYDLPLGSFSSIPAHPARTPFLDISSHLAHQS